AFLVALFDFDGFPKIGNPAFVDVPQEFLEPVALRAEVRLPTGALQVSDALRYVGASLEPARIACGRVIVSRSPTGGAIGFGLRHQQRTLECEFLMPVIAQRHRSGERR